MATTASDFDIDVSGGQRATGVAAIARDLYAVASVFAALAAIFLFIRDDAAAGRVSATFGIEVVHD